MYAITTTSPEYIPDREHMQKDPEHGPDPPIVWINLDRT